MLTRLTVLDPQSEGPRWPHMTLILYGWLVGVIWRTSLRKKLEPDASERTGSSSRVSVKTYGGKDAGKERDAGGQRVISCDKNEVDDSSLRGS